MDKSKLAYLAGFFDGEGCIILGNKTSIPILEVTQTQTATLEYFLNHFGGHIYQRKLHEGWKPAYCWTIHGYQAVIALEEILPFLIQRKTDAEKAIGLGLNKINKSQAKLFKYKMRDKFPLFVSKLKNRHKNGASLRQLAKKYQLCHETLRQWFKEY